MSSCLGSGRIKAGRSGETGIPACRQAGIPVSEQNVFCLYFKQSCSELLYKGLTGNIDERLSKHFNGKVESTKNRLPMKLIHVEICINRIEARKMEKFFKSGYGREIIKEIGEEN